MLLERIGFDKRAPPYDAQFAAQHSVRYLLVREQVKGKRVLDVACGQGFGSHLMAQWGAAEVVGVDIAREAIDIELARSIFPHKRVQYEVGAAITLDQVLGNEPPFDVIVCLETIEHVSQPERLLEHLATFRGLDSTLVISCPNDHIEKGLNPYNLRRFTFEEFRDLATEKLGAATQWLLGVPVLGQLNYVLGDTSVEEPGSETINAIRLQQLSSAFVAPANETMKPDRTNCTYYVGVWGTSLKPNAVIAPQSQAAFVEPWRTIEWLRQQQQQQQEQQQQQQQLTNERYQALRRRLLFHTEARNQALVELKETEARNQALVVELEARNHALVVELEARNHALVVELEARNQALVELKETEARNQALVVELEARNQALVVELEEVSAARAQRDQELAALNAEVSAWRRFRQSRSYRAVSMYYGLYRVPIISHLLIAARRIVHHGLAFVRRTWG